MQFSSDQHRMMAVISVLSAKDNFNAARMIAGPICPASAFAKAVQRPMMIFRPRLLRQQDQCQYHKAAILAFQPIAAVLQETEPEDWQEIPASAGLPKLSESMIYLYINDGPESLLAHHLTSIARDAVLH